MDSEFNCGDFWKVFRCVYVYMHGLINICIYVLLTSIPCIWAASLHAPLLFLAIFFSLLRRTISSASENYPESIGTMYFINTPRTFSTLWSAIRGWLRERTINKIKLLSKLQAM